MGKLLLMRHGKSMWNADPSNPLLEWKYAGAIDVPLSEKGIQQAIDAGHLTKSIDIDVVYCSMLIRAQTTALIALAAHDRNKVPLLVRDTEDPEQRGLRAHKEKIFEGSHQTILPMYCSYDLNERDFGRLAGMFEREQKNHFDAKDLECFRTNWSIPFPMGESNADVFDRTIAFFERHIRGQLEQGKNVFICCHGFVIRVILAYIQKLSPSDWQIAMKKEIRHEKSALDVPNATPFAFDYIKSPNGPLAGEFVKCPDIENSNEKQVSSKL
mmetsp:Transcript_2783/g.3268  ORF Transcript_2783/g.3268 Transcript_2783/m.3268 type:complete len:270 (+) Transcript_2783:82-891(+)